MADTYWAAREGDILLHTSIWADIAGAAVELACYGAIGLIPGGFIVSTLVGIAVAASGLNDVISDLSEEVSNLFPLAEDGKIKTGSPNTRTNGKASARAAGAIDQSIELSDSSEEPQQPESFIDIASNALNDFVEFAENLPMQLYRPTVASPDPRAKPRDDDKILCCKHPHLPGTDEYLAEGSSKVYINSQPAVRSNDRSTCEAKVTDDHAGGVKVSNNVRIGGEPIVVREIRSGKHPVALAASIFTILLNPKKICNKFFCFATTSVAVGYLSSKITAATRIGHPVHLPTGAKLLFGTEDLDFTLPAHLPLQWQRFYSSVDTRSHNMFGAGWSVSFEVEIEISPQPDGSCAAVYINEQGRRLEIDPLQPGEGMRGINENLTIRRGQHNRWVIEDDDGLYRLFEPDPNQPHRLYLTALQDRNDNRLLLYRDSHSRIIEITDNDRSTRLSLHYQHPQHPQRVTTIKQQLANGHSRVLAQYQYTAQGDLQHVIDAEQRHTRTFAYDTGRRLIYHRLPTGLHCHYQWDYFADAAETAWRVTHHWTEADGQRQEDYHFHYDIEQRLTTVKDSLGRISQHYWNEVYQITRYIDPLGHTTAFEWNDNQQLISVTDAQGGQWRYSYDEQGRETAETDPLGRTTQTQWLPHWALPTISVDPDGSTWRYYYDERGNLLTVIDPLKQRTRYQYDQHGQITRITDARGGHKYLRWNPNGQLIQHTDCSGSLTQLGYDRHGNLTDITNAIGNSSRYQYNAAGDLISATLPDGRQEHFSVNAAGQLLTYTDPAGHTTHYHRDPRGLVHRRTDSAGRSIRFHYDTYSRLTTLTNENGEHYQFTYDAGDRLTEQTDLGGRKQKLTYDQLDNVSAVHFAAGSPAEITHRFTRDAIGRLIGKHTPDGNTAYQYDPADNLIKVGYKKAGLPTEAEADIITFRYDIIGNLLSETTAQGTLSHQYDQLGNRIATTLPDGRTLNNLYYGSGHLHQINLDGTTITDIERDRLHREVLRSQGQLNTEFRYDRNSRLQHKQTRRGHNTILPDILTDRRYQYDNLDRLVSKKHTRQGQTDYHYDRTGRIESCRNQAYWETLQYDAAANLLDKRRNEDSSTDNQNLIRFNQLLHFRGLQYTYDAHGRTHSKQTASGTQYYHYDAEHRLTEVRIEKLNCTERYGYVYDALGRRIEKHQIDRAGKACNRTRFLWDGLRMIQETRTDRSKSVYIYTDESGYEPLARVETTTGTEQKVLYYHTDVNGAPEELTDEDGHIVWACSYQLWGKPIQEIEHSQIQQNLRYQGQYLDRETGLHYNTFRYYDPDIGRFTQPDPIGLLGGFNLYQYAPNGLMWIDPWGLWTYNTMPKIDGFQKHHIIPQQLKNHNLIKAAGMNIHSVKNIMYLPTSADAHATRTIHNGSHFAYTRDIEAQMSDIYERGQKENWTQKQYKQALNKLIKKERINLRSGKTILNKNSIRPSKGC
ncbi:RHS repeat-associated core domain-containing protein [Snodgrassella alvi]|uniref:RHS repeat-associated core domain-containing protein n=1 Tax=Snodgrassella alvi TaxID=1196083 RepID=UPI003513C6B0